MGSTHGTHDIPPRFSKKLPIPMGESGPYLTHGSLGPPESPTKRHLDRFSPFAGRTSVTLTDRQTTLLGR